MKGDYIMSTCYGCNTKNSKSVNHTHYPEVSVCSVCGHPVELADQRKLHSHKRMPIILFIAIALVGVILFFIVGPLFGVLAVVIGLIVAFITKNRLTGRIEDLTLYNAYVNKLASEMSSGVVSTDPNFPTFEEVESYIERLKLENEKVGKGETIIQSEEKQLENDKILNYVHNTLGYGAKSYENYPKEMQQIIDWVRVTDDRFLEQREQVKASTEFIQVFEENTIHLHREVFTPAEVKEMEKMREHRDLDGIRKWTEIGAQREDGWAVISLSQKELMDEHNLSPEAAWERAREIYLNDPKHATRKQGYKDIK